MRLAYTYRSENHGGACAEATYDRWHQRSPTRYGDFLYDRCANGQQVKLLTVVDEWTRECLAIEVDGRITAKRVVQVLHDLMQRYGSPAVVRNDNGPEFVARAVKTWLAHHAVQTAYIDAGKPWQNGTNESAGSKLRDACLNLEWFRHRLEARVVLEQ